VPLVAFLPTIRGVGKRQPRKPETDTQATLMRRIEQELARRGVSEASLARSAGMNQKTLNDIINGAVPKLTQVHNIALGLGVTVSDLLDAGQLRSQEIPTNVRRLPDRYPPIFPKGNQDRTGGQMSKRNKSRA
jgi:lambda repressor-like predicted transcriptional regulator